MSESYTKTTPAVKQSYTFEQKWGDDPFTGLGHTQVPNALIEYGPRIGLTLSECWLITTILKFKHTPADPYPSQERLAQLVCKDEDSVRRILKAIERKGLMAVNRVRGELGHYTHSVYDFQPLRDALNRAYYQDHPEERPQATVQKRTVVHTTPQNGPKPPRKISRNYPAKSAVTTVQNCGPNKTLERIEKEIEKTAAPPGVLPSALSEKKSTRGASDKALSEADTAFAREWRRKKGIPEPKLRDASDMEIRKGAGR